MILETVSWGKNKEKKKEWTENNTQMEEEYGKLLTEDFDSIIHIHVLENKGEENGRHHTVFSYGHVFVKYV